MENAPKPIPNEEQESFLFDLPSDPQKLTEFDYDMLDKRYGVMIDRYISEGKIKNNILQGSLWIKLWKHIENEIPSATLEAYLRNRRKLTLSEFSQVPPWSTSKVIRPVPYTKKDLKPSLTFQAPLKPPTESWKDKSSNDDTHRDDSPTL